MRLSAEERLAFLCTFGHLLVTPSERGQGLVLGEHACAAVPSGVWAGQEEGDRASAKGLSPTPGSHGGGARSVLGTGGEFSSYVWNL